MQLQAICSSSSVYVHQSAFPAIPCTPTFLRLLARELIAASLFLSSRNSALKAFSLLQTRTIRSIYSSALHISTLQEHRVGLYQPNSSTSQLVRHAYIASSRPPLSHHQRYRSEDDRQRQPFTFTTTESDPIDTWKP